MLHTKYISLCTSLILVQTIQYLICKSVFVISTEHILCEKECKIYRASIFTRQHNNNINNKTTIHVFS